MRNCDEKVPPLLLPSCRRSGWKKIR